MQAHNLFKKLPKSRPQLRRPQLRKKLLKMKSPKKKRRMLVWEDYLIDSEINYLNLTTKKK